MSDEEAAAGTPLEVARTFVGAIAWGEHRTIWELLGQDGRKAVLRVALSRGMDDVLASRLREGTATASEENEFLSDLVNGLRADLTGTDLDILEYELDSESAEPGRARVVLNTPVPDELGGALPVGSVELSRDGGHWRVERLVPRVGK